MIYSFDTVVMNFVQEHLHNPITDAIFPLITALGEVGVIWILFSLILLFSKKYRHFGILALSAMSICVLFGEGWLKGIVERPRPFVDFPEYVLLIPAPSGFSFPSSHSSASFAAAVVFFFANKKAGICALVLASLIAFSRIFLFVHYPTDVLAGILIGIVTAVGALLAYRYLAHRRRRKCAHL